MTIEIADLPKMVIFQFAMLVYQGVTARKKKATSQLRGLLYPSHYLVYIPGVVSWIRSVVPLMT